MKVLHDEKNSLFTLSLDGFEASVKYRIFQDGVFDVRRTFVPDGLRGKGVAGILVKAAYDYAREKGLKPVASCSYAVAWLERHPEYEGRPSDEFGGKDSCAL